MEFKELELDITEIYWNQKFGYENVYYKKVPIKHKRKTIDGVSYNTNKAKLIMYIKEVNELTFIYEQIVNNNKMYFRRQFNLLNELPIELINNEQLTHYYNKYYNSLF